MKKALSILFVCTAVVAHNARANNGSSEGHLKTVKAVETIGKVTQLDLPFKKVREFFCKTIAESVAKNSKATQNDPKVEGCSDSMYDFSVTFPLSYSYRLKWEVKEVEEGRAKKAPVYKMKNNAKFSFTPSRDASETMIELIPDSLVRGFKFKDALGPCIKYDFKTCPTTMAMAKVANSGDNDLKSVTLEYGAYSDDEETYHVNAVISAAKWKIKYSYIDDENNGDDFIEYTGGPKTENRVSFESPYYRDMKLVP
ncbi:MAG: hypothetical protein JNM39_16945 [Bdellovibrionaceae bacterium]|nr:hypothetical protein [Pseudobdellovibrionaceae bacterium]